MSSVEHPAVLLFDGDCGLCSRGVRFLYARDPRGRLLFCALQSERGRALLRGHGLPEAALDTVVLLDGEGAHVRSTAALRALKLLRWPWPALAAFLVVPRRLRDAVYDFVARRRHRVSRAGCVLPEPGLRERMLE